MTKLQQDHPEAYKWYHQASAETLDAVYSALQKMREHGACPLNPNIMGGLIALGALDARPFALYDAIGLFEAMQ